MQLAHLEAVDQELAATRTTRSRFEYYFTCTAAWALYLLDQHPQIDIITYLDADLYFFSDPQPLFDELGDSSVLIIEHRFPDYLRHLEMYGRYNVGWLSFRNNRHGREVLERWRKQCLEWCYDRLEGARFADQKYLDQWPECFAGVVVSQLNGANLAPWNVGQYRLWIHNRHLLIEDQPLIFYHFHKLNQITLSFYNSGFPYYKTRMTSKLRTQVYVPYLRRIKCISKELNLIKIGNTRLIRNSDLYKQIRSAQLVFIFDPFSFEVYLKPMLDFLGNITRPFRTALSALHTRARE